MHTTRAGVMLAALALVVAACGGGGAVDTTTTAVQTTTPTADVGESSISLVGENIAFNATRLNAPAGREVTITFENRDAGVSHNLRIAGPSGPIATKIEKGPITQTLTFTIDEPGTYQFLCEVHPTAMKGDLVIGG